MLTRRRKLSGLFVLFGIMLVALAACNGGGDGDDSPAPAATSQPPVPAVVTRIVTPRPTFTPQPTPTLSYDILSVADEWIMRLQLVISGGPFADEITYWGAATVQVNPDTTVTGTGTFNVHIQHPPCTARVLNSEPMTFTLNGATRLGEADQVWADFTLIPDEPFRPEPFELVCPTYGDVRTWTDPILWPVHLALGRRDWGTASFEATHWSFVLVDGQTYTFEADVSQETSVLASGYLAGEVSFGRN
ncbi:MAG: hypothetical protein JXQ72_08875 [Anaerolineae bacterium]|nr:hypothetical protein [Anaerolineae bacterium]